jgi:hypothetical protein
MKIQDQRAATPAAIDHAKQKEREQPKRAEQRGQGATFADKLKDAKPEQDTARLPAEARRAQEEQVVAQEPEGPARLAGASSQDEAQAMEPRGAKLDDEALDARFESLEQDEQRVDEQDEGRFNEEAALEHVDHQQVQAQQQVNTQTESVAHSATTDRQAVAQLVDKLVRSCQLGQDQKARRVMLMEVEIPGRGNVHVRLQQQSQGLEVRFRARDEPTAQLLRAHQGQLEEGMRQRGVAVSRVSVSSS